MEVEGMAVSTRFPPKEVLKIIFSNLGKNDLLNSRLVAQDWNKDCLRFLKKSKFRLTLDYTEIDDYISFIIPNHKPKSKVVHDDPHQPQLIMPIHLKFNPGKYENGSHDNLDGIEEASLSYRIFEELEKLTSTVKRLQDLFGSECVRELTLIHPGHSDETVFEQIFQILYDLSPVLEKLDIRLSCKNPIPKEEKQYKEIVFPKVQHLSLDWCRGSGELCINDTWMKTSWKLIQGCPNLETLVLGNLYLRDVNHCPAGFQFPPPGIKSFKFKDLPSDWLLTKLKEHPPTMTLQSLCISFKIFVFFNCDDGTVHGSVYDYQDILRLLSPLLRSLTMPFRLVKDNGVEEFDPFPLFPALTSLTITDFGVGDLYYQLDPSAFPALEMVSIPYDAILNEELEENAQFPSVKSLTLTFSYEGDPNMDWRFKNKKKIASFPKIFPNIYTITFENDIENLEHGEMIKYDLNIFLQLPQASQIQVLELINFDQNYVGILLEQIHHPQRLVLENVRNNPLLDDWLINLYGKLTTNYKSELKVTEEIAGTLERERPDPDICQTIVEQAKPFKNCLINMKKIRLLLNKQSPRAKLACSSSRYEEDSEAAYQKIYSPKKLYLNEMMATFPNLEEIEVSSVLFACNAVDSSERMKRITKKFPGLRINII